MVIVVERNHIAVFLVWSAVIISFGLILLYTQRFLCQIVSQISLWSCKRNRLSGIFRMLVDLNTLQDHSLSVFCLVLFLKESTRYVSNTTITSSKYFVRFKILLLKHIVGYITRICFHFYAILCLYGFNIILVWGIQICRQTVDICPLSRVTAP